MGWFFGSGNSGSSDTEPGNDGEDSGQQGNKKDGLQDHPQSKSDDYDGCEPGKPTVPRVDDPAPPSSGSGRSSGRGSGR